MSWTQPCFDECWTKREPGRVANRLKDGWTTDKIRAKFFAKRFADSGVRGAARLAVGRVMKADCIGYLNGRSESEVVVFPENVDIVRVGKIRD